MKTHLIITLSALLSLSANATTVTSTADTGTLRHATHQTTPIPITLTE